MTQTKTFDHVHCAECEKKGDSVFCCLHGEPLDDISNSKTCSVYRKGQVLFNEGIVAYKNYFIVYTIITILGAALNFISLFIN